VAFFIDFSLLETFGTSFVPSEHCLRTFPHGLEWSFYNNVKIEFAETVNHKGFLSVFDTIAAVREQIALNPFGPPNTQVFLVAC
jgi:hypothetical protein